MNKKHFKWSSMVVFCVVCLFLTGCASGTKITMTQEKYSPSFKAGDYSRYKGKKLVISSFTNQAQNTKTYKLLQLLIKNLRMKATSAWTIITPAASRKPSAISGLRWLITRMTKNTAAATAIDTATGGVVPVPAATRPPRALTNFNLFYCR